MLRRVAAEHRRFVVLIAVVLAANAGVCAGVVYPLASRVANADSRAARASRALAEARRELAAAKAIATSRERAERELRTFYADVLPASLDAAHNLTYLDLAQRARQHHLTLLRRTASEAAERGSGYGRLAISAVLEGQYSDIRQFLHSLETAPKFVVIDDIAIDHGRDAQGPLALTLQLSTYFRVANHAS